MMQNAFSKNEKKIQEQITYGGVLNI